VPRLGNRFALPTLALPLLALLLGLSALAAPASAGDVVQPRPLLWSGAVGDPSVIKVGDRRVVVATGHQVNRAYRDPGGDWKWTAPVLASRPEWAKQTDHIWAADIARAGRKWVLYYSVPVHGLTRTSRCIGVAVARRPLDPFHPVGTRPLVCPKNAHTPRAQDKVKGTHGLNVIGVIDPSAFVDRGKRYLLYKTDGIPSSIRLLPLTKGGLGVRKSASRKRPSIELLRSPGVIENPVMLRRKRDYYLFASEGDYARCTYRQTWRRSTSLKRWADADSGVLLNRKKTGKLCGPAGGDILVEGRKTTMYFHGWVRRGTTRPMPRNFWALSGEGSAIRAMYGARLSFPSKEPTVRRFLG
jgi:arabinan endo-1,5-alpha-L-arabinosidase